MKWAWPTTSPLASHLTRPFRICKELSAIRPRLNKTYLFTARDIRIVVAELHALADRRRCLCWPDPALCAPAPYYRVRLSARHGSSWRRGNGFHVSESHPPRLPASPAHTHVADPSG